MAKIAIDPITRVEGHLRIEVQVDNGKVTDAWSCTPMFRGLELILKDRDPRDAWVFTQRICGVCTTVNALASVRAVENALGIVIPDNARILRNIMEGIQYVHDHVIHFYHLHGPDWVDITSALTASASATSNLQKSLSTWGNNSPDYFSQVQAKLKAFVDSGQLGLFANGYWGHPAYKLPPEGNLLVMAHYLEALDWQRDIIKIHAIIGGKNPHPQTYLVGGMASPLDLNSPAAINNSAIATLKSLATLTQNFVNQVYVTDTQYIASKYLDWANIGVGVGNYLSYGDFPNATGCPIFSQRHCHGQRFDQGGSSGSDQNHRRRYPCLVSQYRRPSPSLPRRYPTEIYWPHTAL
jgi:Ni,Fe-hydrogenase I large subunit